MFKSDLSTCQCTQIEQNVVYAELCFLLLYLFMIKVLNYEKFINTYFNEINSLIKKNQNSHICWMRCIKWHSFDNSTWKTIKEI